LETTVRDQTNELETEVKHAEEIKERDKKLQEAALQIQELENKVREKDIYSVTLEVRLRREIRELEEELQETDMLKKEAESDVHAQREYYKRKQQERDTINEQVQDDLYGIINRVQKELQDSERCITEIVDSNNRKCGLRRTIKLQNMLIDELKSVCEL
jgi:DNA repair exonuclease SbcCD ATPase subunit